MKSFLFFTSMLCWSGILTAEDRLSWLRDSPMKKEKRSISSKESKTIHQVKPGGAWTISSKDPRKRSMTIDNKKPATSNSESKDTSKTTPKPVNQQSETEEGKTEKKKTDPESTQFDPSTVSPEQLNAYIASLEAELSKLNEEAAAYNTKEGKTQGGQIATLTSNAKRTLQATSPKSLKSEFNQKGSPLSDAQAEKYLSRLLETIKSQD